MTLRPDYRKCSKCGRIYSWNPDAGKISCPYCKKDRNQMRAKPDLSIELENIKAIPEMNRFEGGYE